MGRTAPKGGQESIADLGPSALADKIMSLAPDIYDNHSILLGLGANNLLRILISLETPSAIESLQQKFKSHTVPLPTYKNITLDHS